MIRRPGRDSARLWKTTSGMLLERKSPIWAILSTVMVPVAQPPAVKEQSRRPGRAHLAYAALAFLLANALLVVVMRFNGTDVLDPLSYVRFDSGHYTGIATGGYELFPCNPARWPAGSWCGNAAWFPLYSYLIRLLLPVTGNPGLAGALLSKAFLLATLGVLACTLRDHFQSRQLPAVLLAAVVFPGAIYYHAVFPISQFLFFAALHLHLLLKRRDAWAGLAGALAAMSYSGGYALAAVSGLYLLLTYRSFGALVRRGLLVSGLTLTGVGAVLLIHQLTLGAWNAWFLVQAKYGFNPGPPFVALWWIVQPFGHQPPGTLVTTQNLVVVTFVALIAARLFVVRPREWDEPAKLYFAYACVFLLAPVLLIGARIGYYRTFALLLPAVVFMARWPSTLVTTVVVVFAVLFPLMSLLFFNSLVA